MLLSQIPKVQSVLWAVWLEMSYACATSTDTHIPATVTRIKLLVVSLKCQCARGLQYKSQYYRFSVYCGDGDVSVWDACTCTVTDGLAILTTHSSPPPSLWTKKICGSDSWAWQFMAQTNPPQYLTATPDAFLSNYQLIDWDIMQISAHMHDEWTL